MNQEEKLAKQVASQMNRRHFLSKTSLGIGSAALASLLNPLKGFANTNNSAPTDGVLGKPHFAPKVKRVIYLFQSGGPSQLELFDYKPTLRERNGQELPDSVRGEQRLTGMTAFQKSFPMAGAQFDFQQYGQNGLWVSDLMPHTAKIVDDICVIRSMKHMDTYEKPVSDNALEEFLAWQERLIVAISNLENTNLNKRKIPVEFFKLIKMKVGDALEFVIVHQQRHLNQIEKIVEDVAISERQERI